MATNSTIFDATAACRKSLQTCQDLPCLMRNEWAENQLADFNLWAAGAGASARKRASLDHRLDLEPDVKSVVINLLRMLQGFTDRCYQKALGITRSERVAIGYREDSKQGSLFLGAGQSDATPITKNTEPTEQKLGIEEDQKNVERTLSQVVRLTVAIRKSGSHSKLQKADSSFDPASHQALREHLNVVVLAKPSESGREPFKADTHQLSQIQSRLIEANLRRHNRFLYAQSHSRKLAEIRVTYGEKPEETIKPEVNDPRKPAHAIEIGTQKSGASDAKLHGAVMPTIKLFQPSDALTATSASAIEGPIQMPTKADSQPSMTVISSTGAKVVYPQPPRIKDGHSIFKCPCCCKALPAYFSKGNRWRKHLTGDIIPYTCILENCPRPWDFYVTREAWMKHMKEEHRSIQYWICFACRDRRRFDQQEDFITHLQIDHHGISKEQTSAFLSACMRSTPVEVKSCPLCLQETPEDPQRILDHIAEHIHSFSMRSLPWARTERPPGGGGNMSDDGDDESYFCDNEYFGGDSARGSARNTASSQSEDREWEELPDLDFDDDDQQGVDVPASPLPVAEECLRSLQFTEMDWGEESVVGPPTGGINWLREHPSWKSWLAEEHSLILIKGGPGSGKSTLMKWAAKTEILSARVDDSPVVASFFCRGVNRHMPEPEIGLIRALLYQICLQSPDALAELRRNHYNMKFEHQNYFWGAHNVEELRELFFLSVAKVTTSKQLYLLVDGLDQIEKPTAVIDLLRSLKNLTAVSKQDLKVGMCVASRPSSVLVDLAPEHIIVMEEHNSMDIQSSVEVMFDQDSSILDKSNSVARQMAELAEGSFLWAKLAVDLHFKGIAKGDDLAGRFLKTPHGLEKLYEQMLENISPEGPGHSLLEWIMLLFWPFEQSYLKDLFDGLDIDLGEFDDNRFGSDHIHKISGGLAKLEVHGQPYVTFIHDSVYEFLTTQSATSSGGHTVFSTTGGHARLAKACLKYLCRHELQEAISQSDDNDNLYQKLMAEFPFVKYATVFWTEHTREAEYQSESLEELLEFLNQPLIDGCVRLLQLMHYNLPAFEDGTSVLHVLSWYGISSLFTPVADNNPEEVLDRPNASGRTPLSFAASGGYEAIVRLLLSHPAVNADSRDRNGQSPLSHAAQNGRESAIKLLLEKDDVDPDSRDGNGRTPLLHAVQRRVVAIVEFLLATPNVDVNSRDNNGDTSLLLAADYGGKSIVQLLLSRPDVDLKATDRKGRSPLHRAASRGHVDVVKLLLENNDVDQNHRDMTGRTALFCAAQGGHEPTVELLLSRDDVLVDCPDDSGTAPLSSAADNGHTRVMELLLDRGGADPNIVDKNGETPLFYAAWGADEAAIWLLLGRRGVDVDHRANNGETPLMLAARSGEKGIIQVLLEAGADLNTTDNKANTPLHNAAQEGHIEVVRWLLSVRADPNTKNEDGKTALYKAAKAGHAEVVRELLDAGADPNAVDNEGKTAFVGAVSNKHPAIARMLLEAGTDASAGQGTGHSQIYWAVAGNNIELVKLLLDRGADVNVRECDGGTPLMRAAQGGFMDIARLLLEEGADVNAVDHDGRTALLGSAESGSLEMRDLLFEYGAKPDDFSHPNWNALFIAACMGHEEYANRLLSTCELEEKTIREAYRGASEEGKERTMRLLEEIGVVDPERDRYVPESESESGSERPSVEEMDGDEGEEDEEETDGEEPNDQSEDHREDKRKISPEGGIQDIDEELSSD